MRRVIRQVSRAAVAGVCLLSLLACIGAGWLWWRREWKKGSDPRSRPLVHNHASCWAGTGAAS